MGSNLERRYDLYEIELSDDVGMTLQENWKASSAEEDGYSLNPMLKSCLGMGIPAEHHSDIIMHQIPIDLQFRVLLMPIALWRTFKLYCWMNRRTILTLNPLVGWKISFQ